MKRENLFNRNVSGYDRYRPCYPDGLFKDIIDYSRISSISKLLEIGIGTGQATFPFIQQGCSVTAVESGRHLSDFVMRKYEMYSGFNVINADFMDCAFLGNSFDLIYSATAFHWLDTSKAYVKIFRYLKKKATVALFWNHPFSNRKDDKSNIASQSVYDQFSFFRKNPVEFTEKDCQPRIRELQNFGFENIVAKLYKRTRVLTTDDYIGLLNTYSDHLALKKKTKEAFERKMRTAIDKAGGKISIHDTIDLYLAQKP